MVMRLLCFRSMVLEPNTPASRISKKQRLAVGLRQLRRSPNHVRGQAQIPDPQIHHVPDQALQVHRRQGSPKGRPVHPARCLIKRQCHTAAGCLRHRPENAYKSEGSK